MEERDGEVIFGIHDSTCIIFIYRHVYFHLYRHLPVWISLSRNINRFMSLLTYLLDSCLSGRCLHMHRTFADH